MWSAVQLQVGPQLGFGGSVSTVVGTGRRYEEVRDGVCIVDCLENNAIGLSLSVGAADTG